MEKHLFLSLQGVVASLAQQDDEEDEEDEEEDSGTQAKGTEGITHTVAEVHRAAPLAKKARTKKRKKKVKKYQNLIDAGITDLKFKRWCQDAFRGTGAKKCRNKVLKTYCRRASGNWWRT